MAELSDRILKALVAGPATARDIAERIAYQLRAEGYDVPSVPKQSCGRGYSSRSVSMACNSLAARGDVTAMLDVKIDGARVYRLAGKEYSHA